MFRVSPPLKETVENSWLWDCSSQGRNAKQSNKYGIYRGRGESSGVVDCWWGAGGAEELEKGVSGTPEEAEAFAGGAGAREKSEAGAATAERGLAGRGPAAVSRQQAGERPRQARREVEEDVGARPGGGVEDLRRPEAAE